MADNPHDHLSQDDRIVWDMVRRSARPLRFADAFSPTQAEEDFAGLLTMHVSMPRSQPLRNLNEVKAKTAAPHVLDRKTHRKISRGTINIDARVDLHGLRQAEAHSLLLHFVQSAATRGLRHVLVITGKGKSMGSDGILYQMVPHWLSTAPFRLYISAYENAARHHGGQGALYLRLRRSGAA